MKTTASFRLLLALASASIIGDSAAAHDLWLIPSGKAKSQELVKVLAASGSEFPEGDHAPDPAKFVKRRVLDPEMKEIEAVAGGTQEKAGILTFTPAKDGVYIVAVETAPKLITLDAEAFNSYLVSDGLSHIYRQRVKEKSLDQPGRERYSKSPKALQQVGTGKAGDPCREVGLPLEIVPLQNPFGRKIGDALKVKVFFHGKPLPEANLGWSHPGDGEIPIGTVRTNAKGESLIPIAKTGLMSIRLTHMTRPKEKDYEWESFWTTLTFRIAE